MQDAFTMIALREWLYPDDVPQARRDEVVALLEQGLVEVAEFQLASGPAPAFFLTEAGARRWRKSGHPRAPQDANREAFVRHHDPGNPEASGAVRAPSGQSKEGQPGETGTTSGRGR